MYLCIYEDHANVNQESTDGVLFSEDLLPLCISRLSLQEVVRCSLVCKFWKHIVDTLPEACWKRIDGFPTEQEEEEEEEEWSRHRLDTSFVRGFAKSGWRPQRDLERATTAFLSTIRSWACRWTLIDEDNHILRSDTYYPPKPPLTYAQSCWAHFYAPPWVVDLPAEGASPPCRRLVVEVMCFVACSASPPLPRAAPDPSSPFQPSSNATVVGVESAGFWVVVLRENNFVWPQNDDELMIMSHRTGLYPWEEDPDEPEQPAFLAALMSDPRHDQEPHHRHHIVAYLHHELLIPAAQRAILETQCSSLARFLRLHTGHFSSSSGKSLASVEESDTILPTPTTLQQRLRDLGVLGGTRLPSVSPHYLYLVVDFNRIQGGHSCRLQGTFHRSSSPPTSGQYPSHPAVEEFRSCSPRGGPNAAREEPQENNNIRHHEDPEVRVTQRLNKEHAEQPLTLYFSEATEGAKEAMSRFTNTIEYRGVDHGGYSPRMVTKDPACIRTVLGTVLSGEGMVDLSVFDHQGAFVLGRSGVEIWLSLTDTGEQGPSHGTIHFLATEKDEWSDRCSLEMPLSEATEDVRLVLTGQAYDRTYRERIGVLHKITQAIG